MNAIRLGVIGCGRAAQQLHLPTLRILPAIALAAVADIDEAQLQTVADRFDVPRRYTNPNELIDDPQLEAIAVCTPATSHAALTLRALAAGKHVLVEKPIAVTLSDAAQMCEAARASTKVTAIGFNYRCHRLVQRARDLIAAGALGEIRQVATVWGSPFQHDSAMPAWRRSTATGGGALFEVGPHHLDAVAFLLGDRISSVQMLDHTEACENESVSLLARTARGVLITSAFSQVTASINDITVLGIDGALSFSPFRAASFAFLPRAQQRRGLRGHLARLPSLGELPALVRIARAGGDFFLSYREEWTRFAHAIRGNGAPAASFADGFTTLKVVHAALASCASGGPVAVEH